MKVLVCGGRGFADQELLYATLDRFHGAHKFSLLIHGAAMGADSLADAWATSRHVDIRRYRAEWKRYGNRSAGPIRNQRMLDEGQPDLVIAFSGGRGTRNMVELAQRAGVPVEKIEWE